MKLLGTICCFIIFYTNSLAQDIARDSAIYTMTVRLEEPQIPDASICGYLSITQAYKYTVLESNFSYPLHHIFITHLCPSGPFFSTGRIYKVIIIRTNEKDFYNTKNEDVPVFKCLFISRYFNYKTTSILEK